MLLLKCAYHSQLVLPRDPFLSRQTSDAVSICAGDRPLPFDDVIRIVGVLAGATVRAIIDLLTNFEFVIGHMSVGGSASRG